MKHNTHPLIDAREQWTRRNVSVRKGFALWGMEVVATAILFAMAGAWPAPDTNEAHYLAKAKHLSDPQWGEGDFFLETPDAHRLFFLVMGPVCQSVPLETAAWIGRVAGWGVLAIAVVHAARSVGLMSWGVILAGAMYSLAVRHTTVSGEWVIGGCEAKVFAWALVLWAVGDVARGKFSRAWLVGGAATAFHVLVGGWGMVGIIFGWICTRVFRIKESVAIHDGAHHPIEPEQQSIFWEQYLPPVFLFCGAALAAVGVLPALALSAGTEASERMAAATIQVVERLPHHLLISTFADGMVARHVLAWLLWMGLIWSGQRTAATCRMSTILFGSMLIAIAGVAVTACEPIFPGPSHAVLRFYWYRLADGLLPLGLAIGVASAFWQSKHNTVFFSTLGFRGMITALLVIDMILQVPHWPIPGRSAVACRADRHVSADAWVDVCRWVALNTPENACFLTPRGAATFLFRTSRKEVVSWKNMPQDPKSILQWKRRLLDCFAESHGNSIRSLESSTLSFGIDRVTSVAARYGADHLIAPVATFDALAKESRSSLSLLYSNSVYGVYHIGFDQSAGDQEIRTP